MPLCLNCQYLGYCPKRLSPVVTDEEMTPIFIGNVRNFVYAKRIPESRLIDFFADLVRDYSGRFFDPVHVIDPCTGMLREVEVSLDALEDAPREWWRDAFCRPCLDVTKVRVRTEARERYRVAATILRASYPFEASLWPVIPANDNHAPALSPESI